VRTVPVAAWARQLVDRWAERGLVCRRFRKGGWLVYEVRPDELGRGRGMSADAIADGLSTYAHQLGWGLAPLEQIQLALGHESIHATQRYLGSELDLADAACDRLGIRLEADARHARRCTVRRSHQPS
jgi:hypothetical protein